MYRIKEGFGTHNGNQKKDSTETLWKKGKFNMTGRQGLK